MREQMRGHGKGQARACQRTGAATPAGACHRHTRGTQRGYQGNTNGIIKATQGPVPPHLGFAAEKRALGRPRGFETAPHVSAHLCSRTACTAHLSLPAPLSRGPSLRAYQGCTTLGQAHLRFLPGVYLVRRACLQWRLQAHTRPVLRRRLWGERGGALLSPVGYSVPILSKIFPNQPKFSVSRGGQEWRTPGVSLSPKCSAEGGPFF